MLFYRYRGYVPTMKFDYGETYGGHTRKYFQDFRSKTLETSKTNYCKGGYFPTYYSFNPDMAISARTRNRDYWLYEPRYKLTTMDHDKREDMIKFAKVSIYKLTGLSFFMLFLTRFFSYFSFKVITVAYFFN